MKKAVFLVMLVTMLFAMQGCFSAPEPAPKYEVQKRTFPGTKADLFGNVTFKLMTEGYTMKSKYEDRGILTAIDKDNFVYNVLVTGSEPVVVRVDAKGPDGSGSIARAQGFLDLIAK